MSDDNEDCWVEVHGSVTRKHVHPRCRVSCTWLDAAKDAHHSLMRARGCLAQACAGPRRCSVLLRAEGPIRTETFNRRLQASTTRC